MRYRDIIAEDQPISAARLRYAKSPYEDDPEFNRSIPGRIKHWPVGLTFDQFDGDYLKERKTVPAHIEDVPHRLMISGQQRVTRSGVQQYLDKPGVELPEADLWQGRYNILDGHHRIVADMLRGLKSTKCQVRDMNTIYDWEGALKADYDDDNPGSFVWHHELAKRT